MTKLFPPVIQLIPLLITGWLCVPLTGQPKPLPGQIMVDPQNPAHLVYNRDRNKDGKLDPVFICGPGDPEDFLYRGKLQPNGTRKGDQFPLIARLKKHGGNCIYLQAVRSHGGDGRRDHNPFLKHDPNQGINPAVLDQWEEWFREMDQNGIVIYFFFYDDSARPYGNRSEKVPLKERAFIQTIVKKFQHHRHLIWCIAEEYAEAFGRVKGRIRNIAKLIRETDAHDHVIAVHHNTGDNKMDFPNDPPIEEFAQQASPRDANGLHADVLEAVKDARGRFHVNMTEAHPYHDKVLSSKDYAELRRSLWACALTGTDVMVLGDHIATTPVHVLNDYRRVQLFMEKTDFPSMKPFDGMGYAGTQWLLANPGKSYLAYAEKAKGTLGIRKMQPGRYDIHWMNCTNGKEVTSTAVIKNAGDWTVAIPQAIGPWCVAWIHNDQAAGTKAPPSSGHVFPNKQWLKKDPGEVGLDPKRLQQFAIAVGGDGVIVRSGYLVAEWGDAKRKRDWASAGKPVMSTLLFFAVHEKKLESVDSPIQPFVKRRWPGKDLQAKDRSMTFRHLANMTSGYARAENPGSHWAYNDYAIKLYGHMLMEVFGTTLNKAALDRMAPLQLQDGDLFSSRKGMGISTSPRDFARIGWLWLHRGQWKGRQVLPRSYFDRYCRADVAIDLPRTRKAGKDYLKIGTHGGGADQSREGPGIYGFNWWFNRPTKEGGLWMPHLPEDAIQANGHWGKEVMLIIPSLKMVVAARGNWGGTDLPKAKLLMSAVEKK